MSNRSLNSSSRSLREHLDKSLSEAMATEVDTPDINQVTDDDIERFLFPRRTSKAEAPPVTLLEIEDVGDVGGGGGGDKKPRDFIGKKDQLYLNGEFKIEIETKKKREVDNGLMNIDTINIDASQTLVSSLRDGGHDSDSSIESEQVPSISGGRNNNKSMMMDGASNKQDPPKPSRKSALEDLRRRKRELETLRQNINKTSYQPAV